MTSMDLLLVQKVPKEKEVHQLLVLLPQLPLEGSMGQVNQDRAEQVLCLRQQDLQVELAGPKGPCRGQQVAQVALHQLLGQARLVIGGRKQVVLLA
jgi:hypothetical protein